MSQAFFTTSSVSLRVSMNHCSRSKISIGVLHRLQTPTSCCKGSIFSKRPAFFSSAARAFLASVAVIPAYFPVFWFILPFSSMHIMTGRRCLATLFTSALSPYVHTMTTPVPNSGSTTSSATMTTLRSAIGTLIVLPT